MLACPIPFPAPSPRAASSRAHLIPSRFVPSYPPNPLDYFAPIALIAITPRLPYRVSGADFLNASNSMPLKMGPWSDSSLLLAYRHAGSMPPRRLISSSHRDALRSPCLPPSPSHYGVGLRTEPQPQSIPANHPAHHVGERSGCAWMSCGRYRGYAIAGAFALSSSLPSNHLIIPSYFFPRPAPSPRLSLACLL